MGPYISQERAGDRETQFGIGLSVPLPLWNRNSGKVALEEKHRVRRRDLLKALRELPHPEVQQGLEEMAAWEAAFPVLSTPGNPRSRAFSSTFAKIPPDRQRFVSRVCTR